MCLAQVAAMALQLPEYNTVVHFIILTRSPTRRPCSCVQRSRSRPGHCACCRCGYDTSSAVWTEPQIIRFRSYSGQQHLLTQKHRNAQRQEWLATNRFNQHRRAIGVLVPYRYDWISPIVAVSFVYAPVMPARSPYLLSMGRMRCKQAAQDACSQDGGLRQIFWCVLPIIVSGLWLHADGTCAAAKEATLEQ